MKLKITHTLRKALLACTSLASLSLIASPNLHAQIIESPLFFSGSDSADTPTTLNWNTTDLVFRPSELGEADLVAFQNGKSVTFSGYTAAILQQDIEVASLSIDTDGGLAVSGDFNFEVSSLYLQNAQSFSTVTTGTSFGTLTSTAGSTLDLNGLVTVSSSAVISSTLSGTGTLTLGGSSAINGHVDYTGDIIVQSGTTTFSTATGETRRMMARSISIGSMATFTVSQGNNAATSTAINLGGNATLNSTALDATDGMQFGTLSVTGTGNKISHTQGGIFSFEALSSTADDVEITLNGGTAAGKVHIKGVNAFDGTITRADTTENMVLELSGYINLKEHKEMHIVGGTTHLNNAVFKGEGYGPIAGVLNLDSTVVVEGNVVHLEGGTKISSLGFASAGDSLSVMRGDLSIGGSDNSAKGVLRFGNSKLSLSGNMEIAHDIELNAYDARLYSANLPADYSPTNKDRKQLQVSLAQGSDVTISGSIKELADESVDIGFSGGENSKLTLAGSGTFSGSITIGDNLEFVLQNVHALGSASITVGSSSVFDASDLAINNKIYYNSGTIKGMSAFAGELVVRQFSLTLDAVSGSMQVDGGALTLTDRWDFTQGINNISGSVTFGANMTIDLTGANFVNNSLTLVSGNGSLFDADWLTGPNSTLDMSKLIGLDTTNRNYSYSNGVLSYTMSSLVIHIADKVVPISAGETRSIIFDHADGVASLSNGYNQAENSSISGPGSVLVSQSSQVSLTQDNSGFTGSTEIQAGDTTETASTLRVGHADALGSSEVTMTGIATLAVDEGIALKNDVLMSDQSRVSTKNIQLSNATGTQASITGLDKLISSTATGGSIRGATLVSVAVQLLNTEGLSYQMTDITLKGKFSFSAVNEHTRNSTTLTFTRLAVDAAADAGTLLIPAEARKGITTPQGIVEEMFIYTIDMKMGAGLLATVQESLTLNLTLSGADFASFMTRYGLTDGSNLIGFELLGLSELNVWYNDVDINILNADDVTQSLAINPLGEMVLGGNIVLFIPEPSSATLSILALAGLLSRRRRKKSA